jgi:hypothetical protein
MSVVGEETHKRDRPSGLTEVLVSLGLFGLAFALRAPALQHFVTADEAKWIFRSAQFMRAYLSGDWAATSVNLTPAVTTTWLGSFGLALYYQVHGASLGLNLVDWLVTIPPFRVDLGILAATRWPMVVLTSLSVVVTYHLARRLLGRSIALAAAILIALDPHFISLSRILGHDAPVTVFVTWSLLALLIAFRMEQGLELPRWRAAGPWWIFSGLSAGLAFLSKAPALFLVPFAGLLVVSDAWRHHTPLRYWLKRMMLWGTVAWVCFVAVWPAAWVEPVERPLAVVNNAFLSATDEEEAATETFWEVPQLGGWYYLVHGLFKFSPLVTIGLVLVVFVRRRLGTANYQSLSQLAVFAVLFTIFLSFGDKRSPRYILPIFPVLSLIAAAGWLGLAATLSQRLRFPGSVEFPATLALILVVGLLIALPYAPYYFTFFNPLLGGPFTAPHWVKLGWGEGLDQVGRWLETRPEPAASRTGSYYASTLAPFYSGELADPTAPRLDYLVLYRKQRQGGVPSPTFIRYYENQGALHTVRLNGIDYAEVYAGPALQPALAAQPQYDNSIFPKPLGFRPLSTLLAIGETTTVEVVWLAAEPLPAAPSTLTLRPVEALSDILPAAHGQGNGQEAVDNSSLAFVILAQGQGLLQQRAEGLIVSSHQLQVPTDLSRGRYSLFVDGQPLGEVDARWQSLPSWLEAVDVDFGQLWLKGFQLDRGRPYHAAETLDLSFAWQANTPDGPDLTVFVHVVDESQQRVTGIDRRPLGGDPPTSAWRPEELFIDKYPVPLPPDLPPGDYGLIVGLYADAGAGPLPVVSSGRLETGPGFVRLATLRVVE